MSTADRERLLRRRTQEQQRAFSALLIAAPHRPLDAAAVELELGPTAADVDAETLRLLGVEPTAPPRSRDPEAAAPDALQHPADPPHAPDPEVDAPEVLERLADRARASGALLRRVRIDEHWDRGLLRPVVTVADGHAVVLSPAFPRARVVDPRTGRAWAGTRPAAGAEGLLAVDDLPARARIRDLAALALRGNRGVLAVVIALTLLAGGLSVLLPLASGLIVSRIVPDDDTPRLVALVAALVLVLSASAALQVAQGRALTVLRSRADVAVGDAIWHRLLTLPLSFHNRFTTADLTDRADAVDDLRTAIGAALGTGLVSSVVAASSLAVVFSVNPTVGGLAVVTIVVQGAVVAWVQQVRTALQRRELQAVAERDDLMLQVVAAVSRVRASAAENRVFTQLARRFSRLRIPQHEAGELSKREQTVTALWPVLGVVVVTLGVVATDPSSTGLGGYIVLTTAIAQALGATSSLLSAAGGLVGVRPQLERLQPILSAQPERVTGPTGEGAVRLSGGVAVEHLTVRYSENTRPVLDGVSFEARPGEFVAIVGPSGSGKSTLLQMLLGFEDPESGTVRFDGRDLGQLPRLAVRRGIGTVLQSAGLFPGSIADNIAAGRALSRDRIWAAAEAAALADEIRAMPMGLETPLLEGAATISGGQRQRIAIARALAGDPRILLLDEATSALDNIAQQVVSDSVASRDITRIVIAHRLSTIRAADRIVVLDRGRVAQTGTFDELVRAPGLFRELALRQSVD